MTGPTEWSAYINAKKPVRILVIIYPISPLFANSEIAAILQQALTSLQAVEMDAKTISLSTWPNRTLMVFDLCHDEYNFNEAHYPENLPVVTIHFQTENKIRIGVASDQHKTQVNEEVAKCHNNHGYASLPMMDDHRNGHVPTYLFPRNMKFTTYACTIVGFSWQCVEICARSRRDGRDGQDGQNGLNGFNYHRYNFYKGPAQNAKRFEYSDRVRACLICPLERSSQAAVQGREAGRTVQWVEGGVHRKERAIRHWLLGVAEGDTGMVVRE
ncbi:hypothetical protein P154DRAFT_566831 [Amniculicola lignicola CBS 123094]|uniref:Uncharacterized protein n=1 Tax=Amniculicola lignicola CBS 123094 TaxID=1392246 RepID=A0A6A5W1Z4_9PLEO|nr:hypothetical protein P154DRAFT_566831 [Amniculicola lignicola CBS 123094]